MHRFYTSQSLRRGQTIIEGLQIAHQLSRVLRVQPGETVIFFNDSGFDFYARIIMLSKGSVSVEIFKEEKNERELPISLTFFGALIKKERMEWMFEKATEIGVAEFRPLMTSRVVRKEFHHERAGKIIKEAAEQSGRARVPALSDTALPFTDAVKLPAASGGIGIFLHTDSAYRRSCADIQARIAGVSRIYLFVGPEGGFTEEEVREAQEAGLYIASLFPTFLRAETAGIAGAAIISALVQKTRA